MPRTITYYYPDENNPSAIKVFQDRSSQIRGFYFKRDYLKDVAKEDYATNYAVYFLFRDEADTNGLKTIYIGQSKLGAGRIGNHDKYKDFWTYCIMFVSDNNIFDANVIDYMEYHFINLLKGSSSYTLDNTEYRNKEPNLSAFDKTTYQTYIQQIEFLLKAEGINFIEREKKDNVKYYIPKSKKYDAKVYFQDGNFIVESGSIIKKPKDNLKTWSDEGKLYNKLTTDIERLIKEDKIEDLGEICRTRVKLTFPSVSSAASFISGASQNGWVFFKDIQELKHVDYTEK
jgi:hypothetical protein